MDRTAEVIFYSGLVWVGPQKYVGTIRVEDNVLFGLLDEETHEKNVWVEIHHDDMTLSGYVKSLTLLGSVEPLGARYIK